MLGDLRSPTGAASVATRAAPVTVEQGIVDLLTGFTAETTPGSARKIKDYREHLRPDTTVYITFLPGSDFADTVTTAKRLRHEGFEPVPHIAARSIPNRDYLAEALARLTGEAGVSQVLTVAGGMAHPLGVFSDSMQLLETGLFDRYGIHRIGVAGHPEGSPDISQEAILAALAWKNAFAERTGAELYLVTQFCFEAAPIIAWDRALQESNNRLPIHIGVPGLATLKALLGHAKACGIGPSMRVLTRQARNLSQLLVVSAPDQMLTDLARYRMTDPRCGIERVHLYPLGGLAKTARWTYAVLQGQFTMRREQRGFTVHVPLA
jgi:methylenetetrahydrofolate reductase (NADPH)